MLIGFRVKNWRSIKNEISFSMLASQERQHGERLANMAKYRSRLLPAALMFGGNAAGKSNFIHAISFMKDFILRSPQMNHGIRGYDPYAFDETTRIGPSEFEVELFLENYIYRYNFMIDAKSVLQESLVRILTTREQILFERKSSEPFFLDSSFKDDERKRLEFAFLGTQQNELFLSNTVDQNIDSFKCIFTWFDHNLQIINPSTQLMPVPEILSVCNQYMPLLDTSVRRLEFREVSRSYIPKELLENIDNKLSANGAALLGNEIGERFFLTKSEDNSIDLRLLFSFHSDTNGKEYKINFSEESDGTKRLFDVLPAFVGDIDKTTILIDEIDRSLHSIITMQLFHFFLERSQKCHDRQIIATTHDLQLMTQDLFRRDEMWIFERREDGTSLIPLSDFVDIRYDKDIRKSYLEGRMGGVPQVMLPLPNLEDCE